MKNPGHLNHINPVKKLITQIRSIGSLFEKKTFGEKNFQWFLVIMAVACLIAVPTYLKHSDSTTFMSSNGTWDIATSLVSGAGYSACDRAYFPFCGGSNQVTAMREPVPVLLMAAAEIVHPSEDTGLIVQIMLYLGTALAIYLTLKEEDARLALIAAFLWVVSVPVIEAILDDTGDLAAAFFLTLGMYFFLRIYREQKIANAILAGILLGFASLSRTALLGVSIGLGMVLLALQARTKNRRQIVQVLIFLAVFCLIVTPWFVRNRLVFGVPVIGSTLSGYNIYRMNYYLGNDPFTPHYVGGDEGFIAMQKLIDGGNLTGTENEAQMQSFYMRAGLHVIAGHPFRYMGLSLYRFIILWFNTGVDASYNIRLNLFDWIASIQQTIFLIAIMFGIGGDYKKNWPYILSLVLGCGAYMAVGAQLRYLVDLMPMAVILSALALTKLISAYQLKRTP